MSEQRSPPSRPAQGPIGWLLSLVGRVVGLVTGALVLRVVLELAGLYFWWPQEASRHVFQVMRRERVELVIALQPHQLGNDIVMLLENGTTHVLKANILLQKPFTVLSYMLVSFMLRLIWLAAMTPLLCLSALTGLTEGLVQRDLRRFGSGLESVFLHRYGYLLGFFIGFNSAAKDADVAAGVFSSAFADFFDGAMDCLPDASRFTTFPVCLFVRETAEGREEYVLFINLESWSRRPCSSSAASLFRSFSSPKICITDK